MINTQLIKQSAGHYTLSGTIDKKTVTQIWNVRKQLQPDNGEVCVDLTSITHSDSAGLALLICLQKDAIKAKHSISFSHIPEQLQQLIELSHLQDILNV